MRTLDSILLSVALPILGSASAGQSTVYVDVNAVPPGTGTHANPYTSIQYAIDQPSTHVGDTVLVAPGTYVETLVIGAGTHVKGVTLRSLAGPERTAIQGAAFVDGSLAVLPRIEGFTLSSLYLADATLSRCIVRFGSPPASPGIFYDDYAVIENCVVTGFPQALTMFAFAGVGAEFRNTIFHANGALAGSPILADFDHCALSDGLVPYLCTQVGTVSGDPGFWDAALGDYRLRPGSVCIDAGSPASAHDPDGTIADVGAIPFDASYLPEPQTYCASELNGDGCYALVSWTGACSATSASPFLLTASGVPPDKFGLLLYSSTPAAVPFQGGTLCLGGSIHRTPATLSGSNGQPPPADACSGVLAFDFNACIQSGIDPELVPGRLVYAQFRYRDPQDPQGYGVGWSDAARFAIAP